MKGKTLCGGKTSTPAAKKPYKTLKYLQNPHECRERGCQLLRQRMSWQRGGEKIEENASALQGKINV